MNFPPPRPLLRVLFGVATVLLACSAFASIARAESPIEGVWSFNGGRVAVQEQSPGVFAGTVVSPTTFSLCAHPAGEQMWQQMVRQPDGSYWGKHQWYFESSECVPNPALGQTAWRVLQNAEGRYLRACFSEPGSNLQPTIAANGSSANATFGCVDSSLLATVPKVSAATVRQFVHLPDADTCLARQRLRIRIKDPENDPLKTVAVTASSAGKKVKAKIRHRPGRFIATLGLRPLQGPKIVVRVKLVTILGQRVTTKQVYRRCTGEGGK
jgi:hypothetical protein